MLSTATSQATHVGDVVVDPGAVHAERVDDEVDDEADASDQAESDQLEPVFRPAHAVQQADVRPYVDDGGVLAHRGRVAAPSGGASR